mmetsp:Transcript_26759/g.31563  ORF Transcript_26759/g.31563 Transcript_26759/m.31563 type:complete len:200 (-) Transcript_26759:1678-2277(-)
MPEVDALSMEVGCEVDPITAVRRLALEISGCERLSHFRDQFVDEFLCSITHSPYMWLPLRTPILYHAVRIGRQCHFDGARRQGPCIYDVLFGVVRQRCEQLHILLTQSISIQQELATDVDRGGVPITNLFHETLRSGCTDDVSLHEFRSQTPPEDRLSSRSHLQVRRDGTVLARESPPKVDCSKLRTRLFEDSHIHRSI